MLRERNQSFKLAFIALDLALGFLASGGAVALHFRLKPEIQKFFIPDTFGIFAPGLLFGPEYALVGTYLSLAAVIALSQVIVFVATDVYHPRRGLSFLREFFALVRGIGINMIVIVALLFFYRGTSFSRLVLVYSALFGVVFHGTGHYAFRRVLERLRARGYNIRRVLVLGTGAMARKFVGALMRHSVYGYRVLGMLGPMTRVPAGDRGLILGNMRDFRRVSLEAKADLVVYALPPDQVKLAGIVDFCDSEGIDCRFIPDWLGLVTHGARVEAIDGIPIFTIRDIPLKNGYYRFVKRATDILLAGVALLLSLPVMLLVAVCIKLASPGPVFFFQERMGVDRKNFKMVKFRTMRMQSRAESDTRWGGRDDERVTWIGTLLRKTSLDELPQILNVLRGDMSIVGPRPERPHFVQKFKSQYAHYMRRHVVKSGITGWAQVQGLRGDTSIKERVEADIFYIENWSFWFDCLIILRTIPSMIRNPGQ